MQTYWSPITKALDVEAVWFNIEKFFKWNLADVSQDYKYSSAGFYYKGKDEFGFLENYREELNN